MKKSKKAIEKKVQRQIIKYINAKGQSKFVQMEFEFKYLRPKKSKVV